MSVLKRFTGRRSTEDVIRHLETTKETLEKRIPGLEAAKAEALERRREALITDPDSDEARSAGAAARAAEDDHAATLDALAETTRRLEAAVEQAEAERRKSFRDGVAEGLESDAVAIVAAMSDIDKALGSIARAHARLQLAISPKAVFVIGGRFDSPRNIADRMVLQGLAAKLAPIAIREDGGTRICASDVVADDGAAFDACLRNLAADIRNETRSAELPDWVESGPSFNPPSPEYVPIYATRYYSFVGESGAVERRHPGYHPAHPQVAAAAIKAGLATTESNGETTALARDWMNRAANMGQEKIFEGAHIVELKVNLAEAERTALERHRSEWRAEAARRRARLEELAA